MSIRPGWWMTLQATFYPLIRKLLRETQTTRAGKLAAYFSVPLLSGKNFNITYLPINRDVSGDGHSFVPEIVLEEVIRNSSHRAIIRRCTCRDGNRCENHSVELGCLLLGEGAHEIDEGVSRHVSVEEALAHMRTCIDNGLIPFVGRFRADNIIWGVRDRGRLLTICFCCRCCCIILNSVKYLPAVSQDGLIRLKGLEILTDPGMCTGCGICIDECFMDARALDQQGMVTHDASLCKGCGRCITVCPEKAVTASVSDVQEAAAEVWGRIEGLIDYR
ncbi:MAG: 4Fe-4S dicluster domain-containing protein [Deltaproteobacteria bacterium]|nr:4Fe-4S dicluster domain-containing protein [Deltaproteobacteria bacterium]